MPTPTPAPDSDYLKRIRAADPNRCRYAGEHFTISDAKQTKPPRPRLTADGYASRGGSPSSYMVRLNDSGPWRRVYVWQFSNAGTAFIRVEGESYIIDQSDVIQLANHHNPKP